MSLTSLDTYSLSFVLHHVDGKLIYNLYCCGSTLFNAKLAQTELDLKIEWDSTPLMLTQACAWLTSLSKRLRSFSLRKIGPTPLKLVGGPVQWSIYPKSLLHLSVPSALTSSEKLSEHLPHLLSYQTNAVADLNGDWIPKSLTSLQLGVRQLRSDALTLSEATYELAQAPLIVQLSEVLPPTLRRIQVERLIEHPQMPSLQHLPLESVLLNLHCTATKPYDWSFLPATVTELRGDFSYADEPKNRKKLSAPLNFGAYFPALKHLELSCDSIFTKKDDSKYVFGFPESIETLHVQDVRIYDHPHLGDVVAEYYGHLLHSVSGITISAYSALKYCFAFRELQIIDFEPLTANNDISGLELSPGIREEAASADLNMFGTSSATLPAEEHDRLQPLIINHVTSHFAHIRELTFTWTPKASEARLLPRTLEFLDVETKMTDIMHRGTPIETIPIDCWPSSLTRVNWLISAIETADSTDGPSLDLGLMPLANLVIFSLCVLPVGFSSNYSLKMGRFPFITGDLTAATQLETLVLRLEGFNEDLRALFSSHLQLPRSLTSLTQTSEGALDPDLIQNAWDETTQSSYFSNLKTLHLGRSTRYPRQPTIALRGPGSNVTAAPNEPLKEVPSVMALQEQHYELAKARRGSPPEELFPRLPRTLEDLMFVCRPSISAWTEELFAALPRSLRSLCIRQLWRIPFKDDSAACVRGLPPNLNTFELRCPSFHSRAEGLSMSHTDCYPSDTAATLSKNTYNIIIAE